MFSLRSLLIVVLGLHILWMQVMPCAACPICHAVETTSQSCECTQGCPCHHADEDEAEAEVMGIQNGSHSHEPGDEHSDCPFCVKAVVVAVKVATHIAFDVSPSVGTTSVLAEDYTHSLAALPALQRRSPAHGRVHLQV